MRSTIVSWWTLNLQVIILSGSRHEGARYKGEVGSCVG